MSTRLSSQESSSTRIRIYRIAAAFARSVPGLELLLVLDGRIRIEYENKSRALASSDILALCRIERASLKPLSESFVLSLCVGPDILASAFDGELPAFDCDSSADPSRDYSTLRRMMAEIACSDLAERPTNRLLFRSRLYRLLDELARHYSPSRGEASRPPLGACDETERRILAIRSYVQENFRSPIALGDLAEALSLTPQYLSKFLKRQLGRNFRDYLRDKRLASALRDLALTADTITSIAFDSGFPNLTAFNEAVKRATGLSPAEYRRARQAEARRPEAGEAEARSLNEVAFESVRELFSGYLNGSTPDPGAGERAIVEVDLSRRSPLAKPWADTINLCFASDLAKADFQEQVALIQNELGFKYARFQGIFGRNLLAAEGPSAYSFANDDKLIDFLLALGLKPFIELGGKPEKINRNHSTYLFFEQGDLPALTFEGFEKILAAFLRHAVNRYGLAEVSTWRFELWGGHDDGPGDRHERLANYLDEFERVRGVLEPLVPAAQLGGPGLPSASNLEILGDFLRGLRERGAPPDYVSFYLFPYTPLDSDAPGDKRVALLWDKSQMKREIRKVKDCARSIDPGIGRFYITEWNYDFSCRNLFHDSCFKAPFIIQNAIDCADEVESFAYWLASDISAEHSDSDAILFGGAGLLSRAGIRKPSYYAYQFLAGLGDSLVAKGDGYIVTARSDTEFAAIVFNYKYVNDLSRLRDHYGNLAYDLESRFENHKTVSLSLRLEGARPGRYKIRQRILNADNGSVLDEWKRIGGDVDLDRSEIAYLERVSAPSLELSYVNCEDAIEVDCSLEPNETRLIEISLLL